MKLKKHEWWMVVDDSGYFFTSTAALTRRAAIRAWYEMWHEMTSVDSGDEKQAWEADRKKGYRCVKCEIREVSE